MVQFADMKYMPTLQLGLAELKAISELSAAEKNLLFPLFKLRPWRGKKPFAQALTKVSECLDGRPFACDLDDAYHFPDNRDRPPVREFSQLLADASFQSWYDLVEQHQTAIPCIRLEPPTADIVRFIGRPWVAERGFGIVLSRGNTIHHDKIEHILRSIRHNNYFVVIDAGWSRDPLQQAAWVSALALRVVALNLQVSLFVSSSSFPMAFGDIGLDDEAPPSEVLQMPEYALHAAVSRVVLQRYNQAEVKYADWATTRPPSGAGGGIWIPRIDLPEGQQVRVFRSRPGPAESVPMTCSRLAGVITARRDWPTPPPSWGHYAIDLTASGAAAGIYHQGTNTAARINIYLHHAIGRFADQPPASMVEPFEG